MYRFFNFENEKVGNQNTSSRRRKEEWWKEQKIKIQNEKNKKLFYFEISNFQFPISNEFSLGRLASAGLGND